MANHARIFRDKDSIPPVEQIRKDVEEIVKRKFPLYRIEFNPENNMWWVGYGPMGESFNCLTFWLDVTKVRPTKPVSKDFDWDDWCENGPEVPCIEFRHGHSYQFLWWVEDEIRRSLAVKYNLLENDDCSDEVYEPSKTFKEQACWLDYLDLKIAKIRANKRADETDDQFDKWIKNYLKEEFLFAHVNDLPEFDEMLFGNRKSEVQDILDALKEDPNS